MSEALSLLAAVAEHADTLNQDEPAPSKSLRSRVEQTCAANGVASTFDQEAELANMVCGVVENYIKRTVPSVLAPSGQQQGVVVNLELLLQLATLVVGIVRRDAAVAAAVDAAAPGQAAASLTDELQLMDVLVKTLNSQDDYTQQLPAVPSHLSQQQQKRQQQQQQQQHHTGAAFQLLMQHGSSSCLSSDSTLPLTPAEAGAAAGVGSRSSRLEPPLSPGSLPGKQVIPKPSAGIATATSNPLPVGSGTQAENDIVSVLKQLYYSNDPSAAATAVALAAKLAVGSSNAAPVTPLLNSLPFAQAAAAGASVGSQDALTPLAPLQQQQQSLLIAAATDIAQQHTSSSLERLNLSSSSAGPHASGPLHQTPGNSALDSTMLIAAMAAAAAAQGDPSIWATALSAVAANTGAPAGLNFPNSNAQHVGFPCTTPPPAGADPAAAAAAGLQERAGKADRYREKRAARASGGGAVKSAGASPTAVVSAAAAASQMRRSTSYQAALSDIRHAPHIAGQGSAVPMDE